MFTNRSYASYSEVPWYRRNWFVILSFILRPEDAPLKRAGFRDPSRVFEDQAIRLKDKLRYRDWEFIYDPAMRSAGVQAAAARGPCSIAYYGS